MAFVRSELAFERGIFANRSRHASKYRWVDGNLVRFRDGVPESIGGWLAYEQIGDPIVGKARAIIAWRPNNQLGRYAAIGTDSGAFLFDGASIADITPAGFVPGPSDSAAGSGYGSDRYGISTYGTERDSSGLLIDAAVWTFDLFGERLVGCFSYDGKIYDYDIGEFEMALVVGAPPARAICMSDERHLFAFGADGIPGLVRWSDRENYTGAASWTPSATNRAGGYELQVRSPFQCGARVRGQVLGWTRDEVFAFTPLNNALVYSRERISTEAGAAGPQAVAVVTDNQGESAYWIGRTSFYVYDGLVRTLPCELRDYVFGDINLLQAAKFQAATNTAFDEVWFYYCSGSSSEIDRAVIYSHADDSWTKAAVSRLCWLDAGVFQRPIAIDASGVIYDHEAGDTADGATMPAYVVSHPIQIGVGEQFADIDQFWPDLQDGSGSIDVSFLLRNRIGGAAEEKGPYTVAIDDEFLPLSLSAREFQLKIATHDTAWELGVPQISTRGGSLR